MPEMTLQEALQTDQVKGLLGNLVQEAVDEVFNGDALSAAVTEAVGKVDFSGLITAAVEPQITALRESVQSDVAADKAANELRTLNLEATRLIEASPLKGTAKSNLLSEYSLTENADGTLKPGRALALIEAETDTDGKVVKTAKQILAAQVDTDVKSARAVLREAAPSFPTAPGGGGGDSPAAVSAAAPPWVQRLVQQGRDPKQFGYDPAQAAA